MMTLLRDVRPEHLTNTSLKASVNYFIDGQGLRVIGPDAEFRIKGAANAKLAARFLGSLDGQAAVDALINSVPGKARAQFVNLLDSLEQSRMLTVGWVPALEGHDLSGVILYLRERTARWIDCVHEIANAPVALYTGEHESSIRSRLQAHGFDNIWVPSGVSDAAGDPLFFREADRSLQYTLGRIDELSSGSLIFVHAQDCVKQMECELERPILGWPRHCVSGLMRKSACLVAGTNPAEILRLAGKIAPQNHPDEYSALSHSIFAASICYHAIEKRLAPFLELESAQPSSHVVSVIRPDGTSATRAIPISPVGAPTDEARQVVGAFGQDVARSGSDSVPAHWFDPDFGRFRWLSTNLAALPLALSRIGVVPHSREERHVVVEQWGLNQAEADMSALREAIAELEYPEEEFDRLSCGSPVLVASTERDLSDRLSAWGEAHGRRVAEGGLALSKFDVSGIKDAALATLIRICYLYTDSLPDIGLSSLPSGAVVVHAHVGSAKGSWVDVDLVSALRIAIGDALGELQTGIATSRQTSIRTMEFRFEGTCAPAAGVAVRPEYESRIRKSRISDSHVVGCLVRKL